MDALYTFWDNMTRYKTKSVHFVGLMNSATKIRLVAWFRFEALGEVWNIEDLWAHVPAKLQSESHRQLCCGGLSGFRDSALGIHNDHHRW